MAFEELDNSESDSHYQAVHVKGRIHLLNDQSSVGEGEYFELQFRLIDNENEKDFAHHAVYEVKQKLSVITRLFGYFSEEYLEVLCEEAEQVCGIESRKIKDHIIQERLIPLIGGRGEKRYADFYQIERLYKADMLPPRLRDYMGFHIQRMRKKMEKTLSDSTEEEENKSDGQSGIEEEDGMPVFEAPSEYWCHVAEGFIQGMSRRLRQMKKTPLPRKKNKERS